MFFSLCDPLVCAWSKCDTYIPGEGKALAGDTVLDHIAYALGRSREFHRVGGQHYLLSAGTASSKLGGVEVAASERAWCADGEVT